MDFLSLSKCPLLLKMPLYTEVPGSFDSVTNTPSDHGLDLGKKEIEAIESLDLGAAQARWNPAAPVAGSTGKEVGEVCELTKGPLAAGVGVEGQQAAVLCGAVRCQPLEQLLRRGGGTIVAKGGRVSFSGDQERCEVSWAVVEAHTVGSGLLVSRLLRGLARHRPFVPTLHLHQRKSSRNLHLQYPAKSQCTPRCQSLITARSNHPPVLGRSGPQSPP
jgi:hypothetical protein